MLLLLQVCFCFVTKQALCFSLSNNNQDDVVETFNSTL